MAVPAELLLSALSECECGGPQGHDGRPPLTDSFPADDVPVTREPPLISEPPLAAEPALTSEPALATQPALISEPPIVIDSMN